MTVQTVAFRSPEWEATVELRRAVLRRPLGLDFTPEQLSAEADSAHLAVLDEGWAIACLVLEPLGDMTLKMRQVAVSPEHQGRGIGRRLVESAEGWARDRYYARMVLHARETAVPFYLALAYEPEGKAFEEVGLPHRVMAKRLH